MVHDRYQIGDEENGLHCTESRKAAAFGTADRLQMQLHREGNRNAVWVYDVMARHRTCQLWLVRCGTIKEAAYRV